MRFGQVPAVRDDSIYGITRIIVSMKKAMLGILDQLLRAGLYPIG